jgi:hypothetical protein
MAADESLSKVNDHALDLKEQKLLERKQKLEALEKEITAREKELKAKDAKRKQIILRIPETLHREIVKWSEEDFRSVNGQIEYLLTRSVRERKKNKTGYNL